MECDPIHVVPPNNTTRPAEMRWTCLDYELDGPDDKNIYQHHFTLRNESGYTFVVSVSAEGTAKVIDVANALRAAQANLITVSGGTFPGARVSTTQ